MVRMARALGMREDGHSCGPCPACGAERRGRSDRRLPIGTTHDGQGWRCHSCRAGGNAITLIAYVETGSARPVDKEGWRRVFERSKALALAPSPAPVSFSTSRIAGSRYTRPPREEVFRVWRSSIPVTEDRLVRDYLDRGRGLDARTVEALDAARALSSEKPLPHWAFIGRLDWYEAGYRLLLPTYEANGELASLRGRSIRTPQPTPKEVAPRRGTDAGARFEVRGSCMADSLGRLCLADGRLGNGQLAREHVAEVGVVITEGGPDYLAASVAWIRDANEDSPAIFGIFSGSWTAEFGRAIPKHCKVALLTHLDPGGERLARDLATTLDPSCRIHRRIV